MIDDDGNFCGGVIAPGINLSVDALYMASALLPRIDIRKPDRVIGKATVPAMQSGVFWGYISMIEGLVMRIRQEFGEALPRGRRPAAWRRCSPRRRTRSTHYRPRT